MRLDAVMFSQQCAVTDGLCALLAFLIEAGGAGVRRGRGPCAASPAHPRLAANGAEDAPDSAWQLRAGRGCTRLGVISGP